MTPQSQIQHRTDRILNNLCAVTVLMYANFRAPREKAGVSPAGAWTGLQLPGHGDMQGFNSSSPAVPLALSDQARA